MGVQVQTQTGLVRRRAPGFGELLAPANDPALETRDFVRSEAGIGSTLWAVGLNVSFLSMLGGAVVSVVSKNPRTRRIASKAATYGVLGCVGLTIVPYLMGVAVSGKAAW